MRVCICVGTGTACIHHFSEFLTHFGFHLDQCVYGPKNVHNLGVNLCTDGGNLVVHLSQCYLSLRQSRCQFWLLSVRFMNSTRYHISSYDMRIILNNLLTGETAVRRMTSRLDPCVPIDFDEKQLEEVVSTTKDWVLMHGNLRFKN